jgi:hypothetical protein
MRGVRRPFTLTGTLTHQFMVLVAVAIFATQFIDLAVTQTLPLTMSGVTIGGVLVRLQNALSVVEKAPRGSERSALAPFTDTNASPVQAGRDKTTNASFPGEVHSPQLYRARLACYLRVTITGQ